MKRIMIISGHNWEAPGAVNDKLGITEFKTVQKIINKVMDNEKLPEIDLVYKARNKYLSKLDDEINLWKPDFVISVHLNAFNKTAQGTETLYWYSSSKGKAYAEKMQAELVEVLGLPNRGLKEIHPNENGCVLLGDTNMPAVLIEPFFIDSVKSTDELNVLIDKAAQGILNFLAKFQ